MGSLFSVQIYDKMFSYPQQLVAAKLGFMLCDFFFILQYVVIFRSHGIRVRNVKIPCFFKIGKQKFWREKCLKQEIILAMWITITYFNKCLLKNGFIWKLCFHWLVVAINRTISYLHINCLSLWQLIPFSKLTDFHCPP